jgi:hypothetical protein
LKEGKKRKNLQAEGKGLLCFPSVFLFSAGVLISFPFVSEFEPK